MTRSKPSIAFVLGGGGHHGAYEVGMLKALIEHGVKPDWVVGTSVGALNGAAIAANPTSEGVKRLEETWLGLNVEEIFGGSLLAGAANLARGRPHMHSNRSLATFIRRTLPAMRFEDLAVSFQCVAASIERAAEHWFSKGLLMDAILASCAIPGVLPPVMIDGEHFVDGGIVNSIPLSKAAELGAEKIYVLHAGRIEQPLANPKSALQAAFVAFEIARRHRFARDLDGLPKGTVAHVLPSGASTSAKMKQLNYRDFKSVSPKVDAAHRASTRYLRSHG